MDKKYLNILEVPEVDLNSTDRLVVIDVSNNIKVLAKNNLNVDLSNYYTKEATNELLNNKADKITVTELATKLKEDTAKLNKDITDLGNRVDSIPVITVDTEMNAESTNPVQNKIITSAITNLSNSVDEKLSNKQPKGDYALKSDLTPLATKSEVEEDVAQLNASLNEKQPKGDYALKTEIPTKVSQLSNDSNYQTAEDVNLATEGLATKSEVNSKQDTLVSGTNIKTINGNSLLGSGNIEIQGGSTIAVDNSLSTTSTNPVQNKVITEALNGKASQSDIPTKVSELTNDSDFQTASQVATAISGINVPTKVSQLENDSDFQTGTQVSNSIATATSGLATKAELNGKQDKGDYATTAQLNGKQDTLVSGTNIKTVNGESLLGEGNILIKSINVDSALSTTSENPVQNKVITNKVNTIEQSITDLSGTIPTKVSDLTNDSGYITNAALTDLATKEEVSAKQDTLVSGTNIKTINGNSILGEGNIVIEGGGGGGLPSFGMSLSGTTITMTEGTIANFFNAIKAGKGNYRAYITKGNLLFSNTGQALTSGDEYFVRFDSVTPIKDKGKANSYYAANESLVIKVNNTSVTLLTGTNWTYDSNVVIVNISGENPTYYYGSRSDINPGTKIYLCYITNNNDLQEFRAEVTSYVGYSAYYEAVTVYASVYGGIRRFYFYDNNTIKSEIYNAPYTLNCNYYDINNDDYESGTTNLTKTQYNELINFIYNNSGPIEVINSLYGNGILIQKEQGSANGWKTMQLLFFVCKYSKTLSGGFDGISKKGWLWVRLDNRGTSSDPTFKLDWNSKTF